MSSIVSDVAGVATAVGVVVAAWQLLLVRRQLTATFEESFTVRYREIIANVPLALMLGEDAEPDPTTSAADADRVRARVNRAFYDYFELCEEELYYRREGRISKPTWKDWREGITLNFRRKEFRRAWDDLKDRTRLEAARGHPVRLEQFTLLRAALDDFDKVIDHDPRRPWWRRWSKGEETDQPTPEVPGSDAQRPPAVGAKSHPTSSAP